MATGGAIVVARDASGPGPRPVSVAWGLGAPVSWVGSWVWCSGSQPRLPLPNTIPHPHPAAAVGGARGPRLPELTSWPGSGNPQSVWAGFRFLGFSKNDPEKDTNGAGLSLLKS